MPEDDPSPISEAIEEALLRIMQPGLLESYQREKQRHREELQAVEMALKRARQMVKRLFGNLRKQKEAELEQEYQERVQEEQDRHAGFLAELRETIRDHGQAE